MTEHITAHDWTPEQIREALAFSRNFATAKPDIGETEKLHIIGLCNLLERVATPPAGAVDCGEAGHDEGRCGNAKCSATPPAASGDDFLREVLARLDAAVRERVGSTVMLTKADACALGNALRLAHRASPEPTGGGDAAQCKWTINPSDRGSGFYGDTAYQCTRKAKVGGYCTQHARMAGIAHPTADAAAQQHGAENGDPETIVPAPSPRKRRPA